MDARRKPQAIESTHNATPARQACDRSLLPPGSQPDAIKQMQLLCVDVLWLGDECKINMVSCTGFCLQLASVYFLSDENGENRAEEAFGCMFADQIRLKHLLSK